MRLVALRSGGLPGVLLGESHSITMVTACEVTSLMLRICSSSPFSLACAPETIRPFTSGICMDEVAVDTGFQTGRVGGGGPSLPLCTPLRRSASDCALALG